MSQFRMYLSVFHLGLYALDLGHLVLEMLGQQSLRLLLVLPISIKDCLSAFCALYSRLVFSVDGGYGSYIATCTISHGINNRF